MYRVQKAEVRVECDDCPARKMFTGDSIAACFREAREDGWKFKQRRPDGWGCCVCEDCAEKRVERRSR